MERRRILLSIVAIGFLLVAAGTMTLGVGAYQSEGQPPNLGEDYIGSRRCASCHNTRDAELWDAWNTTIHAQTIRPANEDTILGDLSDSDSLTVTWPDGEERPITAADITYVIGGNYTQQYISVLEGEDGENSYLVLPVVWNIPQSDEQEGVWSPFYSDGWTDRDWRVTCAGCHTTGLSGEMLSPMADLEFFADKREGDVEIGIGCESCHGPGGNHRGVNPVMSTPDAQACGQCHGQGHDPSGEFPFPLDYQPGLPLDEDVFVLAGADDEAVWWPDGHTRASANQYSEWLNSRHATALTTLQESELAEDSCLRCHASPPDPTDPTPEDEDWTLADAQYGVTCVTCHNLHPSESRPRPPFDTSGGSSGENAATHPLDSMRGERAHAWLRQVFPAIGKQAQEDEDIVEFPFLLQADKYELCVGCHNSVTPDGETMLVGEALHHPVQEMYEGLTLVEGVEGIPSAHFSEEDGPRCVTCHMPRTAPIGEYGSAASHTLSPVFPGTATDGLEDSCTTCHSGVVTATDVQTVIDEVQNNIRARLDTARAAMRDDCAPWVQSALDFVEGDGSLGIHNYIYTDTLLDTAEVALGIQAPGEAAQDVNACLDSLILETEPEVKTTADTVAESLGLPVAVLILLGAGAVFLLIAVVAFLMSGGRRWRKLLGLASLILGMALIVVGFAWDILYEPAITSTGDNSYCMVCHSGTDRVARLANGSSLPLSVNLTRLSDSVHGDQYEGGRFGCVDCHGADYFPHEGILPASFQIYRLDKSEMCLGCHADQGEHYLEVLTRNIAVGCADCHSAHYTQPASELATTTQP